MANGRIWTAEEIAIAKAGFEKGLTHPEIAALLQGRTTRAVRHVLHEMGCKWSGDELERRRVIGIERARADEAVAKAERTRRHRPRFRRIDETGNCWPNAHEQRMKAIEADMAFRQEYCSAALRNGWTIREYRVAA